jgi:hypothetical protein
VRKSKTGHAERAAHVAGLVVMLALFVLAKAGVIPMWVVTFGLSWTQLAMLTIGLMLVSLVAGVIVGRLRGSADGR